MYRLRTVAGGSGTELRITALRLRQGSKYRVAGLPHRRSSPVLWFDKLANTLSTIDDLGSVPEETSQLIHRKPYPALPFYGQRSRLHNRGGKRGRPSNCRKRRRPDHHQPPE